ncbi:uncharacterized protein LOC141659622 [Apium graveolens]|uniref:uncharacterized protein LOC141659622 n=1 Tax=Apium graveolens TaxID=4045 RepID=UPI003D7B1ED9
MNRNNNNAQGNNKYSTMDVLQTGFSAVNATSNVVKAGLFVKDHLGAEDAASSTANAADAACSTASAADAASSTADVVDAASSTSDVIMAALDIASNCSIM